MVVTKMGMVTRGRNSPILPAATAASNGLGLLSSGLLRLCALWLRSLGTLWLCLLGTLRLNLLCALWRCFLGALRLCFLCVLRLLLVLRRLRFSSASALFLFAFLCERRNGGCEK